MRLIFAPFDRMKGTPAWWSDAEFDSSPNEKSITGMQFSILNYLQSVLLEFLEDITSRLVGCAKEYFTFICWPVMLALNIFNGLQVKNCIRTWNSQVRIRQTPVTFPFNILLARYPSWIAQTIKELKDQYSLFHPSCGFDLLTMLYRMCCVCVGVLVVDEDRFLSIIWKWRGRVNQSQGNYPWERPLTAV